MIYLTNLILLEVCVLQIIMFLETMVFTTTYCYNVIYLIYNYHFGVCIPIGTISILFDVFGIINLSQDTVHGIPKNRLLLRESDDAK